MKMGRPHIVHLSHEAIAVIRSAADALGETLELPKGESGGVPYAEIARKTPYVFTTRMRSAVSGFSNAKEHLDDAIAAVRKKAAGGAEFEPMPPWVIHDFRRSFATGCALREVPSEVVEKVLDHNPVSLKGVAGTYNRFEHLPQRKAVLEMWGNVIAEITSGERAPSNVINLHRAGR